MRPKIVWEGLVTIWLDLKYLESTVKSEIIPHLRYCKTVSKSQCPKFVVLSAMKLIRKENLKPLCKTTGNIFERELYSTNLCSQTTRYLSYHSSQNVVQEPVHTLENLQRKRPDDKDARWNQHRLHADSHKELSRSCGTIYQTLFLVLKLSTTKTSTRKLFCREYEIPAVLLRRFRARTFLDSRSIWLLRQSCVWFSNWLSLSSRELTLIWKVHLRFIIWFVIA